MEEKASVLGHYLSLVPSTEPLCTYLLSYCEPPQVPFVAHEALQIHWLLEAPGYMVNISSAPTPSWVSGTCHFLSSYLEKKVPLLVGTLTLWGTISSNLPSSPDTQDGQRPLFKDSSPLHSPIPPNLYLISGDRKKPISDLLYVLCLEPISKLWEIKKLFLLLIFLSPESPDATMPNHQNRRRSGKDQKYQKILERPHLYIRISSLKWTANIHQRLHR